MMCIKKSLLLCVALFLTWKVNAAIRLPAVLGDHMVLQQQSTVRIWGWSDEDTKEIKLLTGWDNKQYSTTVNPDGSWEFRVSTPAAGGPYVISLEDGHSRLQLKDILIGEVWLCSGQSNMEIPLSGYKNQPVLNGDSLIAAAANSQLRLFKVQRAVAEQPQQDVKGSWQPSGPESAAGFSAVAFQYGTMLQKALRVPVGIIESAWGGTPIRAWMSKEALQDFPDIRALKDKAKPKNPSVLYQGMIAPLTRYAIRGFLWYQGENDRLLAGYYTAEMQAMVKTWRAAWNLGELPFYFVQIAPWKYTADPYVASPFLREAQYKASKTIPGSGMAVTADIGSDRTIHPPDKTTVASRLLKIALAGTYHQKGISWEGPEVKKVKYRKGKAVILFKHTDKGLVLQPSSDANFKIAGEDHVFHTAGAKITGRNRLELQSEQVKHPAAVRYGFTNYFAGNLFNSSGLPASPFRTDQLKMK